MQGKLTIIDFLKRLKHSLETDDNRCTANPVWVVQQQEIEEDITTCADCDFWRDEDYNRLPDEATEVLDSAYWAGDDTAAYDGTAYYISACYRISTTENWVPVQTLLTEAGAEDYINLNGHNLKKPRIYVDSAWRNDEIANLRRLLPALIDTYLKHYDK
jgi:hypothetical protein